MKLSITLNGRAREIEILAPAPQCRFRFGTDQPRDAFVESIEPGVYFVLLDGRVHEVRIDGNQAMAGGHHFEIEVQDPRAWSPRRAGRAGEGQETIAAPMPGKVVRVLVAPGEMVQAGLGLVVVEAMKMQNEMRAPRDGRVLRVSACEGCAVSAGEALVIIE
jgi:biotin carboxyl carrier protein